MKSLYGLEEYGLSVYPYSADNNVTVNFIAFHKLLCSLVLPGSIEALTSRVFVHHRAGRFRIVHEELGGRTQPRHLYDLVKV